MVIVPKKPDVQGRRREERIRGKEGGAYERRAVALSPEANPEAVSTEVSASSGWRVTAGSPFSPSQPRISLGSLSATTFGKV